jgi:hypothetical protein
MTEDCTRCGASMVCIIDHGCPLGASAWCLNTRLEAAIAQLNGYQEVIAPGAFGNIPDEEIPVTFNWGPRIGTARLRRDQ